MSRVLLDENMPVALRTLLGDHEVFTVEYLGWKSLTNGRLLDAAGVARFDVMVTADQNLGFQQSLAGRSMAVVFLSTTRWRAIKASSEAVRSAVDRAGRGSLHRLEVKATPAK